MVQLQSIAQAQLYSYYQKETKTRPTPHNSYSAKLKAAEESLSLTMENAKRSYEASLVESFSSTKSNKIYKYISALKSNDQIPSCVYLNNTTVTTDEDEAKLLNHYFFSVFTHSAYQLSSMSEVAHSIPISNYISINEQEVYMALPSLDTSKSAGIDPISPCSCSKALYNTTYTTTTPFSYIATVYQPATYLLNDVFTV